MTYKIIKVLLRINYIFRFLLIKLIHGSNFNMKTPFFSFIGKWHDITISNGSVWIGRKFYSRKGLTINVNSGVVHIGNNVFFNQYVSINSHERVFIGSDTIIGDNVRIYDHNHVFNQDNLIRCQGFKSKPITIGNNVWIGSGVIILSGSSIGDNSVISAGSIINDCIPENSLYKNDRVVCIIREH